MMPIKTSELTGQKLDRIVHDLLHPDEPIKEGCTAPPYSSDWSFGGPIIEREKIGAAFNGGRWVAFYMVDELDEYDWDFRLSVYGPTPLVASMRCFVASKLGEEIEIIEEVSSP